VHLIAGLTSVHFDRRSILRPPGAELKQLAADFQRTFRDPELRLEPLSSGDFLMLGPSMPKAETTEPARLLVRGVAEALPGGAGATALRRLGAEIEMWLHEHPVNETRARRGEPPVSALWLWGGGPLAPPIEGSPRGRRSGVEDRGAGERSTAGAVTELAFGPDAYLAGLWHLHGGESRPIPDRLEEVFGYPHAQRAALVLEVAQVLHSNLKWTLVEALGELDRRFISPALEALRRSDLERVVLVANDRQLIVRSRNRLKLWRRPRLGFEGLQ
jgi:hypothetical protein